MPHRPGMRPLEEQVREALDAGITMLQLREKYLSEEDFLREALSIRKLTERYHVPLIINDSLYVAINSGADGIHIGQSDLPARQVRAKLGPDKILGVTAKTVAQALEAEKAGADYLGSGAVFPSPTKTEAIPMSRETLTAICQSVHSGCRHRRNQRFQSFHPGWNRHRRSCDYIRDFRTARYRGCGPGAARVHS